MSKSKLANKINGYSGWLGHEISKLRTKGISTSREDAIVAATMEKTKKHLEAVLEREAEEILARETQEGSN